MTEHTTEHNDSSSHHSEEPTTTKTSTPSFVRHTTASAQVSRSSTKDNWILGLLITVTILVLINLLLTTSLMGRVSLTGAAVSGTNTAGQQAVAGDGTILIEEYSDFQCPFCSRAIPSIKQVMQEYGDKVTVVYKHFPLDSIHPFARKAAEDHDMLFANQGALDVSSLKQYASTLGLNTATFNTCLDTGAKASVVDKDFADGRAKGVSGTPSFFINGEALEGAQPFSAFKAVIDRQLAGGAPNLQPSAAAEESLPARVTTLTVGNDPIKGSPKAPVLIYEYSDFECPFCGRAAPTVERILQEYGDKVAVVFKQYPLPFHPNAQKAAEASECAQDQGKFWEYHDTLFANQDALSVTNLKQYAATLGLNTATFNTCLDSGEKASEVAADAAEGSSFGVQGTPGFFVNGITVRGAQPFEVFKEVIDAELGK